MKSYQARFNQVIEYIESNLDSALDIDELCNKACLSKFHFHRQCSAYFNMSVMSLVRLLKLKRAAYELAYRSDIKIIDIALANGYESHEAFSRSFKKIFSQSPSDFRKLPDWAAWQIHYQPVIQLRLNSMSETQEFDVKIIDVPALQLATLEHRGSPHLLGQTIAKFIEWRKANKMPPSKHRTFNLVYDDPNTTAPEDYRFDVCCEVHEPVAENTLGIVTKSLAAGKCAVIRYVGSDDGFEVPVKYLYTEWLEKSGYELRDSPLFFERVSFFPEVPENQMVTDIYLPLK